MACAVFGALFDIANAHSTMKDCSGGSDDAAVAAATSGEATGAREPSAGAGTDAGGALRAADVGPNATPAVAVAAIDAFEPDHVY